MPSAALSLDPNIVGVVLAGGSSRRMGTDKRWLRREQGETFLQGSLELLQSVCQQVWISGGTHWEPLLNTAVIRIIADVQPGQGPMAGLIAALAAAHESRFAAVLCIAVDTPDLIAADLIKLIHAFHSQPDQPPDGILPDGILPGGGQPNAGRVPIIGYSDRIEPLIGIYPVQSAVSLRASLLSGQRGLSKWLLQVPHQTVDLPKRRCRNINRPEDLKR